MSALPDTLAPRGSDVPTGPAAEPDSSVLPAPLRPRPHDLVAHRSGVDSRRLAVLATVGLAVLVPAVTILDVSFPGRSALAILFALTVPGVPLAVLLRVPAPLVTLSLAVGISLSANLVLPTTLLVAGWWHPVGGVAVLGNATLILSAYALTHMPTTRRQMLRVDIEKLFARLTAARGQMYSAGLLTAALLLWLLSTMSSDISSAGSLGVLPATNWSYYAAVVLIMAVVTKTLVHDSGSTWILSYGAVALALVLFGFVNVADSSPSVPTGWLHAGFIDYILQTGTAATSYDARFSWPAFFAAGAQLVHTAGVPDATWFLTLAPVVTNVLIIPPLLVIGRCITRDRTSAWLGVYLYHCFNWFQQDYFAPQAIALLLYATVISTLLWCCTRAELPRSPSGSTRARLRAVVTRVPGRPPGIDGRSMVGLELALIGISTAIVVTHQLTPVSLVLALVTFTVTGSIRFRRLWLITALIFVLWVSYGAVAYWSGHLDTIFGDLGEVGSILDKSVGARLVGDPTYHSAQLLRMVWACALLAAATVGLSWVRTRDAVLVLGLALAPFCLALLQSYGGEVLLRCFVFAAPVLAPLAALFVSDVARRTPRARTLTLACVLTAAAVVLTFTRGVNVSFERMPKDEVAASEVLYELMATGDRVGVLRSLGAPTFHRRVTEFSVLVMDDECAADPVVCAEQEEPEFVLITTTQDRQGELKDGLPPGWSDDVVDRLEESGLYRSVYRTPDADLLQLTRARR